MERLMIAQDGRGGDQFSLAMALALKFCLLSFESKGQQLKLFGKDYRQFNRRRRKHSLPKLRFFSFAQD
jgi:hypothetical protein